MLLKDVKIGGWVKFHGITFMLLDDAVSTDGYLPVYDVKHNKMDGITPLSHVEVVVEEFSMRDYFNLKEASASVIETSRRYENHACELERFIDECGGEERINECIEVVEAIERVKEFFCGNEND